MGLTLSLWIFIAGLTLAGITLLLGITGCKQEEVAEPFEPRASHGTYIEGLEKMDLAETAMGRRWIEASEEVMGEPVQIELPFREQLVFDPADPSAAGYLFSTERGRKIRIGIEYHGDAPPMFFADLFRVEEEGEEPIHIASYSREEDALVFEPQRDNRYLFRLQPELLRGGRYTVSIEENPALAFPVEGKNMADIHSFFGDPRDAGRRLHEGVDIFALRGTAVLSVSGGTVRRVGTRELGGKVVLVRDEERGLNYYYAHLDEQYVERGRQVEPGDPLGAVGNTGNAVTTPPHLHFGIYEARWNAIDPWNFLKPSPGPPPEVPVEEYPLRGYMRTVREVSADAATLPEGTVVRIIGAGATGVRAGLPAHSQTVEIAYEDIETIEEPPSFDVDLQLSHDSFLYASPAAGAVAVAEIAKPEGLSLLGVNGWFYYVETRDGRCGWIRKS